MAAEHGALRKKLLLSVRSLNLKPHGFGVCFGKGPSRSHRPWCAFGPNALYLFAQLVQTPERGLNRS